MHVHTNIPIDNTQMHKLLKMQANNHSWCICKFFYHFSMNSSLAEVQTFNFPLKYHLYKRVLEYGQGWLQCIWTARREINITSYHSKSEGPIHSTVHILTHWLYLLTSTSAGTDEEIEEQGWLPGSVLKVLLIVEWLSMLRYPFFLFGLLDYVLWSHFRAWLHIYTH